MSERNRISSTADTGNIGCPFFIAHGKKEIVCEGLIAGCRMCSSFEDPEKKSFHQHTYCEQEYRRCEMYLSIQHWKWPED